MRASGDHRVQLGAQPRRRRRRRVYDVVRVNMGMNMDMHHNMLHVHVHMDMCMSMYISLCSCCRTLIVRICLKHVLCSVCKIDTVLEQLRCNL